MLYKVISTQTNLAIRWNLPLSEAARYCAAHVGFLFEPMTADDVVPDTYH